MIMRGRTALAFWLLQLLATAASVTLPLVAAQDATTTTSATDAETASAAATTTTTTATATTASAAATTTTAAAASPSATASNGLSFMPVVDQLLKGYDLWARPNAGTTTATAVYAQYRMNRLFNVDPTTNAFSIDLYLKLQWSDPRLVYSGSTSSETIRLDSSKIWVPDVYFYNEHAIFDAVSESCVLKDPTQGIVVLNRHFVASLTSPFQLADFPFDDQAISIQLASYSYNASYLTLNYYPAEQGGPANPSPFDTFSSVLWTLYDEDPTIKRVLSDPSRNTSATYQGLWYSLFISRDPTIYILKYILPLFFVAFCSCVSYWVDPGVVPARVGFGVTLLLATVTLNFVVSGDLPKVNYATKMDYYVITVFTFVFGALVEFTVVHYLKANGSPLLSKHIERFFRIASVPTLILAWIFVTYATGTTISRGVEYGTGSLIGIVIIICAVLTVLGYMKEAREEPSKKASN
ncbi:neurotransmitter-gated ion-channel ligand-binding domain-containing protein [Zopfochytrium polystomum]|nr:neurotransmitter-gated ion-channel ligand-binding domain-containing protein [Zopfochytrium polystomum]